MKHALLILAASVAVAGCASVSRSMSYGTELADASPTIEGRRYSIYVHPTDQTILLQRPVGTSVGQSFVGGLTLGIAEPGTAYGPWKAAAMWCGSRRASRKASPPSRASRRPLP